MKLGAIRPCTFPTPKRSVVPVRCSMSTVSQKPLLGTKWKEYQGINNWEGLLDPLDDTLRGEILRYGKFVGSTYTSFDFDTSSPSYATCRFPKQTLLNRCGLEDTGYRLTKNLHATSGTQLPRFFESKFPSWVSKESSWIGYVAVCQDKEEISRLGRRDVVIAYRGTATCLEWLENLRSKLTQIPNASTSDTVCPMVESGFQSLYTSSTDTCCSLQEEVKEEISKVLEMYGDEPLSFTITGHSLGAALATLTAYDISTTFDHQPAVTVISFGGPRVGNRSFRHEVEKCGTKILRIVNSDDIVPKVPGFVFNDDLADDEDADAASPAGAIPAGAIPRWFQKRVKDTQWVYADVGHELRLNTRDSPILHRRSANFATCHELGTYLHLVNCSRISKCPLKSAAKQMLNHRQPC